MTGVPFAGQAGDWVVVPYGRLVRRVEWIEEGAVGGRDRPADGTLAELLIGGPYPSLTPPEIPPLLVVNEMLSGRGGSGMNGGRRWSPFAIDETEYQALVDDLVRTHGFIRYDVPNWVASRDDWHIWLMERRRGVPAEPHRQLRQRARELTRGFEHAQNDPNVPSGQLATLFLAAQRAQEDAAHFSDPWVTMQNYTKYRRTARWVQDARHCRQAADIAGDATAVEAADADIARLRERLRSQPDEQWPAEWEDWPDYPPFEQRM
jgi:hypothetical protein